MEDKPAEDVGPVISKIEPKESEQAEAEGPDFRGMPAEEAAQMKAYLLWQANGLADQDALLPLEKAKEGISEWCVKDLKLPNGQEVADRINAFIDRDEEDVSAPDMVDYL